MARTALLYVPTALVLAFGWLRLEDPRTSARTVLWIVVLALVPALGRRARERVVLAVVAATLAAHHSAVKDAYFAEPQATVNRDFTRVLFNSNWGVAASNDVDTYMIQLPPGAFP